MQLGFIRLQKKKRKEKRLQNQTISAKIEFIISPLHICQLQIRGKNQANMAWEFTSCKAIYPFLVPEWIR